MPTLDVQLPDATRHGYHVYVEPGGLSRLGDHAAMLTAHRRLALVVDDAIADSHGPVAATSLADAGFECIIIPLTATETAKRIETVSLIHQQMLEARLERAAMVVAMGGGIVGDIAGFAASTYLRGIALLQVPTTVLGMVDASIGGKTGVNVHRPDGGLGKNLVGSFWQPRAVIADPRVLRTLDPRDFRCGLAESIKHAIIDGPDLLEQLERDARAIHDQDEAALTGMIAASAAVKIGIVQQDERESGVRAHLNLGHTFAHAIEAMPELDVRHGEAVAIGLRAAALCAQRTDRLDSAARTRIEHVIRQHHLPDVLPAPVAAAALREAMGLDKKVREGRVRLVLPVAIGQVQIVDDVPEAVITDVWRELGAS